MDYSIDRREEHRACVIRVDGDIDLGAVPELRQALDQVIATGCSNVVIDLTGVTYADSSALGLLVWLDHQLQPRSGKAVLAGANRDVERIFELSGLLMVTGCIEETDDLASAMACLDAVSDTSEVERGHSLSIAADVQRLAEARERIVALIRDLDFSDSALFDIQVALGEALANAVRHGSRGQDSAVVTVAIAVHTDRVVFEVTDMGSGFDGEHTCSDDLYAAGGRGVMFMRALMDSVCFAPAEGGGTTVRLVKHRAVDAPGALR